MNDNKNMILAVVLSAIVLFGWSFVSERFFPTANPPVTKIENGHQVPTPQPQAGPASNAPAAVRDRAVVLRESPRVAIRTPRLAGSINLTGARIDDLVLTTERETIEPNSPPIRLFSPAGAPGAYFAGFGWTGQGVARPRPHLRLAGERRPVDAGDAGDLELEQQPGPDLRNPALGRRRLSVHRRATGREPRRRRGRRPALLLGQPGRPLARSRHLDRPCRADRRVQRQCRLRQQLERHRHRRPAQLRQPGRLARLHRQILAGRDRPRSGEQCRRLVQPQCADRRLPGRLCGAVDPRPAEPGHALCQPRLRRRQGGRAASRRPIRTSSAPRSSARSTGAGSAGS